MTLGTRSLLVFVFVVASVTVSAATSPRVPANGEVADLGRAPPGTVDQLRVDVRNPACTEPQSFRFVPNNLPWIKMINGDRLVAVAHGQTKTFVAQINLSGMKPGHYSGILDVECETCGQYALSLCDIDKRRVTIKVEVVRS